MKRLSYLLKVCLIGISFNIAYAAEPLVASKARIQEMLAMDGESVPARGSLAYAVYNGNELEVLDTIKSGCDINGLDCNHRTPLQEAIIKGHEEIAVLLSDCKGILLDTYSKQGFTALHYAVAKEQCCIVDYLLMRDACVDLKSCPKSSQDKNIGLTALHIAAMLGNVKLVTLLLRYGADPSVKDNIGRTPFHYAVYYASNDSQHKQVAELLLKKDRSLLNIADVDGAIPLIMPIIGPEKNNKDIVKFLLEEGTTISCSTYQFASDIKNVTPLIAAIAKNRADIVSLFIEAGCDINALDSNKHTALDYAIYHHATEIQKLLLSRNGKFTLSRQDVLRHEAYWVLYPLHEAAYSGNLERVRLLIEKDRIGINEQDQSGSTPLHYACMNGHEHIVRYLVDDRRAMMCVRDQHNKAPIYYAVEQKHDGIVKYMVQFKPRLISGLLGRECIECVERNRDCATSLALLASGAILENPLHWAIAHDLKDVVIPLVNKPEYVNQQDGEGKLPIHKAIDNNSYFYTDLLIRVGSKLTVADRYQNTVLSYCKDLPKLRELIRTLTDVDYIAQKHAERCDMHEEPLNFNDAGLKYFGITGTVEPSLSQVVPQDPDNLYCGYYALFNAICALRHSDPCAREPFVDFFKKALTLIKEAEGKPPYGNLSTSQIRYLIKRLYDGQNIPVAVIENNSLYAYLEEVVQKPEEAFEINEDNRDLLIIKEFIEKRLDQIAIIIGRGTLNGHWITLHASRSSDGSISCKLFDSYARVAGWTRNFLRECCSAKIIIFYLLLTTPMEYWKKVINKEFLEDMRKLDEVQNALQGIQEQGTVSNFIKLFDDFIESMYALRQSIGVASAVIDRGMQLSDVCRIQYNIRLQIFAYTKRLLLRELDSDILKRNPCDMLNKDLLDYCRKLYGSDYQKFIEELASKCLQATPELAILWQINLQRAIDATVELKNKLSTKSDSMVSGNFYDAPTLPLSEDKLAFMKRYLQYNIQNLVRELNEGQQGCKTVLFYGPPGNGKTTIAQAIAQWCPCKNQAGDLVARPFRIIRVPALGTQYQFSKQQQIASLKKFITENPTAVILLDEVDALSDSNHDQDNATEVMQELFDYAASLQVIFIATTNTDVYAQDETDDSRVKKNRHIGEALVSRFQKIEKIDNPTRDHREAIIYNCFSMWQKKKCKGKDVIIDLTDGDITSLAKKTSNFSIRDIITLFELAYQSSFSEQTTASCMVARKCITRQHFDHALQEVKRGKGVHYWPMLLKGLKQVAIHGSPWLGLLHSVYLGCRQELHYQDDKKIQEQRYQEGKERADAQQFLQMISMILGVAFKCGI